MKRGNNKESASTQIWGCAMVESLNRILLIYIGFYGGFTYENEIVNSGLADGFIVLLADYYWQLIFMLCGMLQFFLYELNIK
ncbi:hypothetical protein [Commensalibacter oyaizuii]|uniref:Uncharacterized protein n=1 Tax=Commensalibacter oyaizuii TaxID=3043873 RepID=A0ABT6Q342_9PROT|nr:hypothetical protein [Commensalibacter sp. TBRC 16381]MDI2091549.1 hypothetical protein [Commensalibacter sp. TBRC 16381]